MMRIKQISLAFLIVCMLVGSAAMIGWIGFQERFRILANSFREEAAEADTSRMRAEAEAQLEDHTEIETAAEAEQVLDLMENRLRDLERNDLPEE